MRRSPPVDVSAAVESAAESLIVLWGRAQEALGTYASPPQLRVLLIVARHGPLNINGLAERLGAIPSSTSRLCDRLESAGFLTRGSVARDRREVAVSLTQAGRELLDELGQRRRDDLDSVLELMSPGEQTALLEGLRAFHSAVERSGDTGNGDASDQLPA